MNFNFWRKYLLFISFLLMAMGLFIVFLKDTRLYLLFSNIIDPVFWPEGNISESTRNFMGFIYTFSGTFILLWGINTWFVVKYAFLPGNRWAWNSLLTTTLVWFVIMFPFSVYYRVYVNAILDFVFMSLVMTALLATRKNLYHK